MEAPQKLGEGPGSVEQPPGIPRAGDTPGKPPSSLCEEAHPRSRVQMNPQALEAGPFQHGSKGNPSGGGGEPFVAGVRLRLEDEGALGAGDGHKSQGEGPRRIVGGKPGRKGLENLPDPRCVDRTVQQGDEGAGPLEAQRVGHSLPHALHAEEPSFPTVPPGRKGGPVPVAQAVIRRNGKDVFNTALPGCQGPLCPGPLPCQRLTEGIGPFGAGAAGRGAPRRQGDMVFPVHGASFLSRTVSQKSTSEKALRQRGPLPPHCIKAIISSGIFDTGPAYSFRRDAAVSA
ncbi:hypothetical protein SDC9_67682 [bioreactor metagenome]|uniref:Uncharacterized protein n=1 Tax=bioreactor metagenome TaxID=1076179 RepID=A0A644XZN0_9ZZZZ